MSVTTKEPIRHAVILTHPDIRSFNAAVAAAYCESVRDCGQDVVLRDLYRMRFNPVLKDRERPGTANFRVSADVKAELEHLRGCSVFTFIYPIWFGLPPAMTKGYIDRVIGSGVTAREIEERRGAGLLSAAHLLGITTSGAREAWLGEQGQREALRELSSRYLFRAFAMKSADTMHIGGILHDMPPSVIDTHLHDVRLRARKICARAFADRHGMPPFQTIGDGS
jgi:NAD(P)H dehydrogenase (quinone)